MSDVPIGDWHQSVRCKSCGEMIDARAAVCYLCGEQPQYEPNTAAARAAEKTRLDAHLFGEGNAARRDHAATRNIPSGNLGGRSGPQGAAYAGARGYNDLVKHIKRNLREAGVGE